MTVGSHTRQALHRIAVLGDARRREILETLSRGPSAVADIARRLPVTRSAVSQHLSVLRAAGLVRHEKRGTRHIYRLDPEGVAALRDYLESLWHDALSSFKDAADASVTPRKRRNAKRADEAKRGRKESEQ